MTKQEILEAVFKKYHQPDVIFLVWYGNQSGQDVDLILVTPDNIKPPEYEMAFSGLDLFQTTVTDFSRRLELADPAITDPVITGQLLYGNQQRFDQLKRGLEQKEVSETEIAYLFQQSKDQLAYALAWLDHFQQSQDRKSLVFALFCLTYAASYHLFARHYQTNRKEIITFNQIRGRRDELLEEVMSPFKAAKNGQAVTSNQVAQLCLEVQKAIMR